jgi:hypothetical protein
MKFRAIFKSMVKRNARCYENAARIKLGSATMHLAKVLVTLVIGTLSVSSMASPEKDCEFQGTLDQLLAKSSQYNQKFVCITGIVHIEFEGTQLSFGNSKVWLDFFERPNYSAESVDRDTKRMNEWKQQFQDECVVLVGRFNTNNNGHFGMWPAGIDTIINIAATEPKKCSPNAPQKSGHGKARTTARGH